MKLLLVDNFDSFTNNIADFLRGQREGLRIDVIRNDCYDFLQSPEFLSYDGIIISPGPGNTGVARDLGISLDILRRDSRPVLGVCLGHQAMIVEAGGVVELAPQPMHGRISQITCSGEGLFAGLPKTQKVMRYHSWTVNPELPRGFVCDAWTEDGIVMGIRSTESPRWGVQFHPESIATEYGRAILGNFLNLVEAHQGRTAAKARSNAAAAAPDRSLYWHKLGAAIDPAALVEAQGLVNGRRPLLLESSLAQEGLSRYSFVEAPADPDRSMTYCVQTQTLREYEGTALASMRNIPVLDYLSSCLGVVSCPGGHPPFPFLGGLIGWLGYELKSEFLGVASPASKTEDAAFRHVPQFFVIDHLEEAAYAAVCLPQDAEEARFDNALSALQKLYAKAARMHVAPAPAKSRPPLEFTMRHDPQAYLARILKCQDLIRAGESYELCLTNQITAELEDLDAWEFYKVLRQRNPATYSGFLNIGGTEVVSSSPERFLRADQSGLLESKPIKGTIRRGATPQEDAELARRLQTTEKERAENLMIVDLVRHDFAAAAIPGSVDVPKLCAIETYKTVHQMVSTIRGRLKPGLTSVDAIRSCFPGGSMTGAPKIRSVEILDQLEEGPRGVYSGAIGWIGYNGQSDLSIVIRTVVKQGASVSIGCGGAITYLSDPRAELDEIMLKSQALVRALAEHLTGNSDHYRISNGLQAAPAGTLAK
ncbi:aminodeoxychorismate synthase component I [Leisingera thetidis]|uniref:aminodeoxychorismate synthase component I n=1 Tax=Leisingera thetidis TaxID=2930199 RepID=UPI0021F7F91A|nr:aminodeoxychorismate synthase component I [Leisingera thetidis]